MHTMTAQCAEVKTVIYTAMCTECKFVHELSASNHDHFKDNILPTLKTCCGKFLEFKEEPRWTT